jgi:SAM-dependent methyltransferase
MAKQVHNLLINHIHDCKLVELAKTFLRGRVVDIGCGTKPYRSLIRPFVTEHVGVDHIDTFHDVANVDIFGSAYQIPAPDGHFDSALCTAVLEHLEEPEQALRECCRVLKPGGYAIYSVPFIWHLHEEPRDFYRYTKYGLSYLFEKSGFHVTELHALSGFWVTFGQLFVYNIYRANRGLIRKLHILDAVGLLIQGAAYLLDKVDKTEKWTWMYMAVVQKPR